MTKNDLLRWVYKVVQSPCTWRGKPWEPVYGAGTGHGDGGTGVQAKLPPGGWRYWGKAGMDCKSQVSPELPLLLLNYQHIPLRCHCLQDALVATPVNAKVSSCCYFRWNMKHHGLIADYYV